MEVCTRPMACWTVTKKKDDDDEESLLSLPCLEDGTFRGCVFSSEATGNRLRDLIGRGRVDICEEKVARFFSARGFKVGPPPTFTVSVGRVKSDPHGTLFSPGKTAWFHRIVARGGEEGIMAWQIANWCIIFMPRGSSDAERQRVIFNCESEVIRKRYTERLLGMGFRTFCEQKSCDKDRRPNGWWIEIVG